MANETKADFLEELSQRYGSIQKQVYLKGDGTELYLAGAGRFNVDAHFGWDELETLVDSAKLKSVTDLSHSQIQTLLGAIGAVKNYLFRLAKVQ